MLALPYTPFPFCQKGHLPSRIHCSPLAARTVSNSNLFIYLFILHFLALVLCLSITNEKGAFSITMVVWVCNEHIRINPPFVHERV